MHHGLFIRDARAEDARSLAVLATQVWLHTYATGGINEDVAEYILTQLTPQQYAALLAEPAVRVLAVENTEGFTGLVALAVVRFDVPCPTGAASSAELQTLYVQEHFIGQGVGQALIRAAEAQARERAGCPLWLTVNAHNARAIAFYDRQGYAKVGTTYFALGEGRHENHVLIGRIGGDHDV